MADEAAAAVKDGGVHALSIGASEISPDIAHQQRRVTHLNLRTAVNVTMALGLRNG